MKRAYRITAEIILILLLALALLYATSADLIDYTITEIAGVISVIVGFIVIYEFIFKRDRPSTTQPPTEPQKTHLEIPMRIGKQAYLQNSWIGSFNDDKIRKVGEYDSVQDDYRDRIPVVKIEDKSVLEFDWKHQTGSSWSGVISIDRDWKSVDLGPYNSLEFLVQYISPKENETRLKVRLDDAKYNNTPNSGDHNSTSWVEVPYDGPNWSVIPVKISLTNDFSWTKNACSTNMEAPDRSNMLQITFGNTAQMASNPGRNQVRIRGIKFVR